MNAVILANQTTLSRGKIPPSSCTQHTATYVTCTAPALGITGVVLQIYPSLQAMFAAYEAKVSALNSGTFAQNFNDCGPKPTYGEVGWNHRFHHTRSYTVQQMLAGTVTDDQAAGRVFCTYTQGAENMVWTENDGRMLGYVAGPVHEDVWNWWVAVHHDLTPGSSMNMTMPTSSATGSGTSPAMSPSPSMTGMAPSPSTSKMGG